MCCLSESTDYADYTDFFIFYSRPFMLRRDLSAYLILACNELARALIH
jgi:hypothetical protein